MSADLGPAATPRPIPAMEDRMRHARLNGNQADIAFGTYLDRTERDQLDARAATAEQERDDALDDLQEARADLQELRTKLDRARRQRDDLHRELTQTRDALGRAGIQSPTASTPELTDQLASERDKARRERDSLARRLGVRFEELEKTRAELGAAHDLIAVIDDATERIDRARATYATRRQQEEATDGLGSPAGRAQDDHAHTYGMPCPVLGCRWPAEQAEG